VDADESRLLQVHPRLDGAPHQPADDVPLEKDAEVVDAMPGGLREQRGGSPMRADMLDVDAWRASAPGRPSLEAEGREVAGALRNM